MIGIDVIKVSRVVEANKNDRFIKKVLTDNEYQYLQKKSTVRNNEFSEYEYSLAGLWAAKEAILKALQIGIVENLKQVEVLHAENGAPIVSLGKEFCEKYNIDKTMKFHLSISHDAGIAIAACFIA